MPNDIDLWPKIEPPPISPVMILKEQASKLGGKTNHLVGANVKTVMDGVTFNHIFELVVPMLDDYHYGLFKVAHAVSDPYPLDIWSQGQKITAEDEGGFVQTVQDILRSERTTKTIANFMALYQPETVSPGA